MTRELIEFAATVRDMDDDAAYTLWLHSRRLGEQYREAHRPDEARFFASLAAMMDARYRQVVAA